MLSMLCAAVVYDPPLRLTVVEKYAIIMPGLVVVIIAERLGQRPAVSFIDVAQINVPIRNLTDRCVDLFERILFKIQ